MIINQFIFRQTAMRDHNSKMTPTIFLKAPRFEPRSLMTEGRHVSVFLHLSHVQNSICLLSYHHPVEKNYCSWDLISSKQLFFLSVYFFLTFNYITFSLSLSLSLSLSQIQFSLLVALPLLCFSSLQEFAF